MTVDVLPATAGALALPAAWSDGRRRLPLSEPLLAPGIGLVVGPEDEDTQRDRSVSSSGGEG